MKYEANVPETLEQNSFWTNVKTRWNYDGNSTWIKLIGATDEDWNAAFTEIDGKLMHTLIKRNSFIQSIGGMKYVWSGPRSITSYSSSRIQITLPACLNS